MKNLIRGHIYQLKRDNFFFGCLALSFGFLMISVRHFSSGPESTPTTGVDSFLGSFLSGDIILYAFMLANSKYSSGGFSFWRNEHDRRPRRREEKILSFHRFYNIRCISISYADQRHRYGDVCIQQIWHGDSPLPQLLCSFRRSARSFCDCTHQFRNYDDNSHQKCNCRLCVWACYSQYPSNLGDGPWFFEDQY